MSIRAMCQTGISVPVLRGRVGGRRYFGIGTNTGTGEFWYQYWY
jgi:hypothetical protein